MISLAAGSLAAVEQGRDIKMLYWSGIVGDLLPVHP
jgi:hypothetical protein